MEFEEVSALEKQGSYFWKAGRCSQFRSSAFHQSSLLGRQQVILHSFNEVILTSTAVLNQYFLFNSLFINRSLTRSEHVKEVKQIILWSVIRPVSQKKMQITLIFANSLTI